MAWRQTLTQTGTARLVETLNIILYYLEKPRGAKKTRSMSSHCASVGASEPSSLSHSGETAAMPALTGARRVVVVWLGRDAQRGCGRR